MAAKHFINDPTSLVLSALKAIPYTNPHCAVDIENKIVYLKQPASSQVNVVSGGGAGHEPSFSAFVGPGLLSAAVSGTIFASPSAEQVRRCLFERVESAKGVLVVVMNYTGDVLNFGMAVEKARAAGMQVEMVVVGDDTGVTRSQGGKVGRRGIAGTVLVHKVAGAIAASGASLTEVKRVAQLAADSIVSIGSSLSHVHVPGREVTEDELAIGETEIGMGIHNESGAEKVKSDLDDTVQRMLKHLLDQSDEDRAFLDVSSKDDTVLLINNLGGVSPLEIGGITHEVVTQLGEKYSFKLERVLVGSFMTSLNGLGFSITLLKLTDKSLLELLEAPSESTIWPHAINPKAWGQESTTSASTKSTDTQAIEASNLEIEPKLATAILTSGLRRLIAAEPEITHYDTLVGDGDCGIGLARGAETVLRAINNEETTDAVAFLGKIIAAVETSMDGTSGALFAIYLNALAAGLRAQNPPSPKEMNVAIWATAAQTALESLGTYTPARKGDRTFIDALEPFVVELKESKSLGAAAKAAKQGAEKTKGMKASLGRTVYVGGEAWKEVPDPGAYGLAELFLGFAEAV